MKFTIISKETNEVIKAGDCPEEWIQYQFDDNVEYCIKDEYHPPILSNIETASEELVYDIRAARNNLLAQTDWTQLPDAPLTPSQKESWAIYRQALRDYPSTITDPLNPPPLPPKPF